MGMNRKLGKNAVREIEESIRRCASSTEISAEAERLSDFYEVSKSRIYEMTKSIRPKRKPRSDKGKRTIDIHSDENLRLVAGWVLEYDIAPSDALLMADVRGKALGIELQTFQRYLRENGLNRKARRNPVTPHRRFECSAPGESYQFDISGTKQRWFDINTRRIMTVSPLEVSKNHPNTKANRVKIWRFVLTDDFSRRTFVRFYGCYKPTSSHVTDFLLTAYAELGVPKILYTDNDAVIKFGRTKRANDILSKALEDQGGYTVDHHLPGNSRATGKVECRHKAVEQFEKVLGMVLAEGRELDIEILNTQFAINLCKKYNHTIHRSTGEKPIDRWESTLSMVRTIDYAILKSAFMADEFDVMIRGDLTFSIKGEKFQLPTDTKHRFSRLIGKRVTVVFPDECDFFTLIDDVGDEFDITKSLHAPDVAGEYKTTAEDDSIRLRNELKAIAKEDAKQKKAALKLGETPEPVIYVDTDVVAEAAETNITRFPKPEQDISEHIAEVAPGAMPAKFTGLLMDFWQAVGDYKPQFESIGECKSFMDTIFESRDEDCRITQSEIEAAIEGRNPRTGQSANHGQLKAV